MALTIDEEGQARTAEWKVRVAHRIYDIAVDRYGMEPGDLLFDCLTFPLSGGQEDLRRDAIETLNAIRQVKAELPGVHTILGVSNCSFGLKPAARRVLNSVFLYEAIEPRPRCGHRQRDARSCRSTASRKSSSKPRATSSTTARREGYDPLHALHRALRGRRRREGRRRPTAPPCRSRSASSSGSSTATAAASTTTSMKPSGSIDPLAIINEHLLDGMRVVGELFGAGKMQLPFVLQSAETMKTAVAHLEPHMEKARRRRRRARSSSRPCAATSTTSARTWSTSSSPTTATPCYNLGIKQPIQNIIEKAAEVDADAIGLSAACS